MTLLDDFIKAAKELASDLEMNSEKITVEHVQTPRIGLDYTAQLYVKERGFFFHLRTETEDEDPTQGEMTASLTISFMDEVNPYSFYENIDYIKKHPHFLSRWVSWALFNFRKKIKKLTFNQFFMIQ